MSGDKKKWIKGTATDYAVAKKDAPGKLGKQARLALSLMKENKDKKKGRSGKEIRSAMYGSKE